MARFYPAGGAGGGTGSDECTAVLATDVVAGKTAVTSDSNDEAGTGGLANKNDTSQEATASLDTTNSRLQMAIPALGRYNTGSKLYAAYSKIRDLIGLTAAKIATGNTILGLAGTYKGKGTATKAQVLSGYTFSSDSLSGASGTMTNNGAVSKSITPSTSAQSYTIPAGYHNGSGKVSVAAIPSNYLNITNGQSVFLNGGFGAIANLGMAAPYYYPGSGSTIKAASGSPTIAECNDGVTRLKFANASNRRTIGCVIKGSIDLTKFKTLTVKWYVQLASSTSTGLWVWLISTDKTTILDQSLITVSSITKTMKTDTIDLSNITGHAYIVINTTYYGSGSAISAIDTLTLTP